MKKFCNYKVAWKLNNKPPSHNIFTQLEIEQVSIRKKTKTNHIPNLTRLSYNIIYTSNKCCKKKSSQYFLGNENNLNLKKIIWQQVIWKLLIFINLQKKIFPNEVLRNTAEFGVKGKCFEKKGISFWKKSLKKGF